MNDDTLASLAAHRLNEVLDRAMPGSSDRLETAPPPKSAGSPVGAGSVATHRRPRIQLDTLATAGLLALAALAGLAVVVIATAEAVWELADRGAAWLVKPPTNKVIDTFDGRQS